MVPGAVLLHMVPPPPVIAPALKAESTVTALLLAALVPQLLPAVTVIFPFWPAVPVVTVMDVPPAPAVIDQPVGTDQVYVVALVTELILYTCPVNPGHCGVVPEIAPGVAGVAGSVAYVMVVELPLVPQEFPARTR